MESYAEGVLERSTAALLAKPDDAEAHASRIVALVHLGQHREAIDAIAVADKVEDDTIGRSFVLEKAYCTYKLGKLEESAALVEEAVKEGKNLAGALQLRAQICYKSSQFAEAASALEQYLEEQRKGGGEVEGDVATNVVAALTAAGRAGEVLAWLERAGVQASESFELAYNVSCALITEGKREEAREFLQLARRVGQEVLEEDGCSDEEIFGELASIAVQEAYLASLAGKSAEAVESYLEVLRRKPGDHAAIVVATSNLVALRGGKRDLFDSQRRLDRLMDKNAPDISSELQRMVIHYNRALLLLYSAKLSASKSAIAKLEKNFPVNAQILALRAAVLIKEDQAAQAETFLAKEMTAAGLQDDVGLLLLHTQAALASGKLEVVLKSLSSIHEEDVRYSPTVVATVVAAHQKLGKQDDADAALEAAASWWSNTIREDAGAEESLWAITMAAADNCVRKQDFRAAAEHLKFLQGRVRSGCSNVLRDIETRREQVLVSLVRVMTKVDPVEAKKYVDELPRLTGLAGLDVDTLEQNFRGGLNHARESLVRQRERKEARNNNNKEEGTRQRRKRKRKIRYPKGFDPGNPNNPPPDPERWIPKRERMANRKKSKRKDQQNIKGAQGAVLTKDQVMQGMEESPAVPTLPPQIKGKGKRKKGGKR